ncbi:MAG: 4'-phosphopantetheinyl transferase family protein [Opitutaceae bacterium]
MPLLPATTATLLPLERADGRARAGLALSAAPAASLAAAAPEFLHAEELAGWAAAGVEKRRDDYLRGRYAAKLALDQAGAPGLAAARAIVPGVFGQPVVRGGGGWQVSIAHSGGRAAAIAFPEEQPLGIDLEACESGHAATLARELSPAEADWVATAGLERVVALTALWAAREALSKVLRTGLMTSFAHFRVAPPAAAPGGWRAEYPEFPQYQAALLPRPGFVLALALPRRTTLPWPALSATVAGF